MSIKNWNSPGANFVPAYQVSGIPFVTSSAATGVADTPQRIQFPFATRFFVIENLATDATHKLRIGFTENGVLGRQSSDGASKLGEKHYFVLAGASRTDRLEIRCKELWFMRDGGNSVGFSVMAGLSQVPASNFPVVTGSITLTGSRDQILGSGIPMFEGVG